MKHIVDTDKKPKVPDGYNWTIESHTGMGKVDLSKARFELYLSKQQEGDQYIKGDELRKELEGKPVLNANLLDYLLAHPELIPEEWKGKAIFFWGTVYRDSGSLCVRYLYWVSGRWLWDDHWLDDDFGCYDPAALLASTESEKLPNLKEKTDNAKQIAKPNKNYALRN